MDNTQIEPTRVIKELNDLLATANYQLALHKALIKQLQEEVKTEEENEND